MYMEPINLFLSVASRVNLSLPTMKPDLRTVLQYFDTITVIIFVNDCEDMKPVVPVQVVLFHQYHSINALFTFIEHYYSAESFHIFYVIYVPRKLLCAQSNFFTKKGQIKL